MIGSAGAMFLLVNGRIMGISGIAAGLLDGSGTGPFGERAAFLAGLVLAPGLLAAAFGAETHLTGNLALLAAGGLLTGLGTRLANGCTSGHGVCGMSRLSLRSVAATGIFVGCGMATVTLGSLAGWL
jgi:uncharacterized membrane protein YedE/YeeE